ncbi:hypothetical protein BBP40_010662 [Aspergillus hancockii]|nr:hypothetical protein BBP40_010662 [Aspergillus hancockii]
MTGVINEKNLITRNAIGVIIHGVTLSDTTSGDLVFWIRPYDGWANRLKDQCLRPAASDGNAEIEYYPTFIPILLEGPYGHTLPLNQNGTVLMIIGGTGITTAVPYIHDQISRSSKTTSTRLNGGKTQTPKLILELEGFTGHFYSTKGCDSLCSTGKENGQLLIEQDRPNNENIVQGAATESQNGKHKMAVLTCGLPHMSDEAGHTVQNMLQKGYKEIEYFEEDYSW